MRTIWGTIALGLAAMLVAGGCGPEQKETEPEKEDEKSEVAAADEDPTSPAAAESGEEASKDSPSPDSDSAKADSDSAKAEADPTAEQGADSDSAKPEEPAPAATGLDLKQTDGLMISNIVLARGVEKRKPVDPGTSFKAEKGVFFYTVVDVKNPDKEEAFITVSWRHAEADKEIGGVKLKIQAQEKWRTWAKTGGVHKAGKWVALVKDENGEELGRAPFEMVD
jgi:hypothetical protein